MNSINDKLPKAKNKYMSDISSKLFFLHIGLHKTGTTFLQKNIFPNFDTTDLCYNPPNIINAIRDLYRHNYCDELRRETIRIIYRELDIICQKKIFLSHEIYSGTPWRNYDDLEKMSSFLKEVFPTAKIILVFRDHGDWLESLYKEAIKDGCLLSIDTFLNYTSGKFGERRNIDKRNVNALDFNYRRIIDSYIKKYGRCNVFSMEFIELKNNTELFISKIERLLETKILKYESGKENKGYTAFSINLIVFLSKLLIINRLFILTKIEPFVFMEQLLGKFDKKGIRLKLAIRDSSFLVKNVIILHRVFLRFGLDKDGTRKRRLRRQKKFIKFIEHYIDWNWDLVGAEKRYVIKKHYRNDLLS